MGMKIDDAINTLEYIKNNPTNDVDAQLLPEAIELFDTAIDTMHKYQKIQKIVNSKTTRLSYELGFRQIRKVLEDGNDD